MERDDDATDREQRRRRRVSEGLLVWCIYIIHLYIRGLEVGNIQYTRGSEVGSLDPTL
jgi:hypothetical protein